MDSKDTYSSAIEDAINYTRWIVDVFKPFYGRRIVEIGLGHGTYRRFLPQVDAYVGMDIDASAVERARSRYCADTFLAGDATDPAVAEGLQSWRLDTVLCVNVLEHIADDKQAVTNMLRMLVPGGHLLIFVPAFAALYSDMDRLAGHCRRYMKKDMQRVLDANAGKCVMARYFNPMGGVGWWVNKWFTHDSLNSDAVNAQVKLFDRWVLPISKMLDPVTRSFFGQSLVCVIKKS